jgi:hypothetical protein
VGQPSGCPSLLLLFGILFDEIQGFLQLFQKFSKVFLIDNDGLPDESVRFRGAFAFDHVQKHVAIDVLFYIKEIGPVILDKP